MKFLKNIFNKIKSSCKNVKDTTLKSVKGVKHIKWKNIKNIKNFKWKDIKYFCKDNLKKRNIFKNLTDLQKRILFTVGALIVYRVGSYIPLPGVNAEAVLHLFDGDNNKLPPLILLNIVMIMSQSSNLQKKWLVIY